MSFLGMVKKKINKQKAINKEYAAAKSIRAKKARAVYFQEKEKADIKAAKERARQPKGSALKKLGTVADALAGTPKKSGKSQKDRTNELLGI